MGTRQRQAKRGVAAHLKFDLQKFGNSFCSTAVFVYFFININNNDLKYNKENNSWFLIEICGYTYKINYCIGVSYYIGLFLPKISRGNNKK